MPLFDNEGKQYYKTEIFFSPKNCDKVQQICDEMWKDPLCDLRAVMDKSGYIKGLSHRSDDIAKLILEINKIERNG